MTARRLACRIIHGDCVQVMRQMPAASVDLVVTDPPYLVNHSDRYGRRVAGDVDGSWVEPAFAEVARLLKPDCFCISFYGWNHAETFLAAWKAAGLTPVGHFVWVKDYASRVGFTEARHEQAYLLAKGLPERPAIPLEDVRWDWRYTGNRLHPTQKPVEALLALIGTYSRPGDVVLDPFARSGSTAVAARRLGRRPLGIELEWGHCCVERVAEGSGPQTEGVNLGSPLHPSCACPFGQAMLHCL